MEGRAVPADEQERRDRVFGELLTELSASGELISAEALGDPSTATVYGWSPSGPLATDGPYPQDPYPGAPYAGAPTPAGQAPQTNAIVPAHSQEYEKEPNGGQQ